MYGPSFPSFWAAIIAAATLWPWLLLRIVAPHRMPRAHRWLRYIGLAAFALTLFSYYVLEAHPLAP